MKTINQKLNLDGVQNLVAVYNLTMEDLSTTAIAIAVAIITALGAGIRELIKALTQRFKRQILKRRIVLKKHPLFAEIRSYVQRDLRYHRFDHVVRKQVMFDFERVRLDIKLHFWKEVISLNNLDTMVTYELRDLILDMSYKALDHTELTLLESGFPTNIYNKLIIEVQAVEEIALESFRRIFEADFVYDSNRERIWAYMDIYLGILQKLKFKTLKIMADMNGEFNNLKYEGIPYKSTEL